jgi:lysophospholipase L1-like esterase
VKAILLTLALALAVPFPARAGHVKVACVGDSITFGVGIANRSRDSYPAQLGRLLGKNYDVQNFGFSGATLLEHGNNPYRKTTAFRDATAFKPNIVVILLGTNDSKTRNWDGREDEFRPDYEALIAHFARLSSPKIYLCLPPPAHRRDGDIRERIIVRERKIIRQIAQKEGLPLIDLDRPFKGHADFLPDGIHPDERGATVIAKAVAAAVQP